MATRVNGQEDGGLDATDRGLQYGDGLFETMAVRDGRARFFDWHLERLAVGAGRLSIALPPARWLADEVARAWPQGRGVVKLILTRGPAARGYRPPRETRPTCIVSGQDWPAWPPACWIDGVRLRWCALRLARQPQLAGLKHLNRLEQVLARSEWDDPAIAEGLMMDDRNHVISGTQTNLFAVIGGRLVTPALDACGVAGVMRRAFRGWSAEQGDIAEERPVKQAELADATELIVTNSLIGAWPVRELAGRELAVGDRAGRFNRWLDAR